MIKKGDLYYPTKEFKKKAWLKNKKIYSQALKNPVKFWEKLAKELFWFKPWKKAFVHKPPYFQWFVGGKINITSNIFKTNTRRWLKLKDKVALIWEPEPINEKPRILTYQELFKKVNKLANALKKLGVKKGDRVGIYLPMIPEVVISMLACARIGAVHCVAFSAFSPPVLKKRLQITEAKILITADGYYRRGQIINLKEKADQGIKDTQVEKVIVVKRANNEIPWNSQRDFWWSDLIENESSDCQPEVMDSEDLLFILFTSGTTGSLLGCEHTCGGYTVQAYWTGKWIFDWHDEDIMWCTADIGWVTGHTYGVYSGLLNGITSVMYEGAPDWPMPDRWAQIIEKHNVTIFYTAPTAIRMFRTEIDSLKDYKFKTLRLLGSVGEPIDEDTWQWYFKNVGKEKCPIVDTWWQTETGGILITSLPGIGPFKPAFTGLPFPGMKFDILDEKGKSCPIDKTGNLVMLPPFAPGLLRGIYKNPKKYLETYWSQYGKKIYFTSDAAFKDKNGLIRVVGRVDEVIKVAGHRLATGELEAAINKLPEITECAVVGIPDEIKGEVPVAFVISKKRIPEVRREENLKKQVIGQVRKEIGSIALPKEVYLVEDLPKNSSGKIMRAVLKRLFTGEELADFSTLANPEIVEKIKKKLKNNTNHFSKMTTKNKKYILWFKEISAKDVPLVGGKNASLGEMISQLTKKGINIPDGFATTSYAYWHFLEENKILPRLKEIFKKLDPKDVKDLQEVSQKARNLILKSEFPEDFKREIIEAYRKLGKKYGENPDVAVRSSATAEDLPTASFAGLHETYLNVSGEKELLKAIKKCIASLFNSRAISYRREKGFDHFKIALSVGVQKMVRSDLASAGVMFTLDTETGFQNVVLINSIYGVGEMIVKGKITPDEFYVFKPTLKQGYKSIIVKNLGRKTKKYVFSKGGGLKEVLVSSKEQQKFSLREDEILTLSKWACLIEEHYKVPQDIEWAKDGKTGQLFIVQARPETVHASKVGKFYEEYYLKTKEKPILQGIAVGNKIGQGRVRIIPDVSHIGEFQKGEVLVTKMTDPDWVSVFPLASAIVTDEGGPTCHAAIVSRELGVPCIVGTKTATRILKNGQEVTIDCSQGKEGRIFLGKVPFKVRRYDLKKIPKSKTKIMINIGAPEIAFKTSFLPNDGVGLAREEFIIAEKIRVHPLALYYFKQLKEKKLDKIPLQKEITKSKLEKIIKEIEEITIEHRDKKEHFIKELAEGIAQIAAAFWPKPVIVRFSDFKTNEYRALVGGELFEPEEANPMLGWRGASRYYDEKFRPAFKMEVEAIKRVREKFGLKNIIPMIPFCRTPEEGEKVLKLMAEYGLERGKDGLKVYIMCEIPSNVILVDKFLKICDGYSIGSNDLTQLILGLDRDSALVAKVGDERNPAVKEMIAKVIQECKKRKKYSGICGQAPSDYPEFAEFLVEEGIKSISLNPDSVIKTIFTVAKKENQLQHKI